MIGLHTCRDVQLGELEACQLRKGAGSGDATGAQHQQPVACWQVLPLMRHQHPRGACKSRNISSPLSDGVLGRAQA